MRTSRRALGRSALIAAMVALPVTGLTAIALVYDSTKATTSERITTELGATEAQLRVVSAPSSSLTQMPTSHSYNDPSPSLGELSPLADALPSGTRVLSVSSGSVTATTATGVSVFDVKEGESWDPAFAGKYELTSGRAPHNDREVLVTASLLPRLGISIGDTVELLPPAPDTVTVVGTLDDNTQPDAHEQFFASEGALTGQTADDDPMLPVYYLPDTELDWSEVRDLNAQGITAVSRAVLLDPPPGGEDSQTLGTDIAVISLAAIVGGFAAFEVILLAGAAFTVTARQQQRALATMASVGAPRRLLYRVLTANGIVLGVIGGILGIAFGIAVGTGYMAITADGSATKYFGFHVPWVALLGFAVFAMLIGWIAALAPARAASRFDVVSALRGARRPQQPSTRRPVVGLAMLVVGVALAIVGGILFAVLLVAGRGVSGGHPLLPFAVVTLVVGPILAQLGLVLCSPLLLRGIARLSGGGRLGMRLASRDAARNPGRAVPALASIMTTVFVAVMAMCLISSGQENSRVEHQYWLATGQVSVELGYVEFDRASGEATFGRYDNSAAVVLALRQAVSVDEVRVLSGVSDPDDFTTIDPTSAKRPDVAIPAIPADSFCPYDNPDVAMDYAAAKTDWRCQSAYPYSTSVTSAHIYVGSADDLALALDAKPSAAALTTLATGGAVSLYREYVTDGTVEVQWWPADQASAATYGGQTGSYSKSETLNAVVELPRNAVHFGMFVSPETADRLGLEYAPVSVLASTTVSPTIEQRDALSEALMTLPGAPTGGLNSTIEFGPPQYAKEWSWGLLALAAVIAIAAAAVAIGLARFDGRQDDATLSSLGASGIVRRSFAFWQGMIIAGAGTLLGALTGLVPALALSANPDWPFMPPWLQIGLTVLVLPVLISLGSWLLAARGRVSARRVSIA